MYPMAAFLFFLHAQRSSFAAFKRRDSEARAFVNLTRVTRRSLQYLLTNILASHGR